jgi:hypothetical protein
MMDQGHAVLQNIRIGIDPADARHETDAMGDMPADELWGPQTHARCNMSASVMT